jgi:hypothetical protein
MNRDITPPYLLITYLGGSASLKVDDGSIQPVIERFYKCPADPGANSAIEASAMNGGKYFTGNSAIYVSYYHFFLNQATMDSWYGTGSPKSLGTNKGRDRIGGNGTSPNNMIVCDVSPWRYSNYTTNHGKTINVLALGGSVKTVKKEALDITTNLTFAPTVYNMNLLD